MHVLVAGGALTKDGAWVSPRRGFLFPAKALSTVFRGKFVAALRRECDDRLAGDPALGPAGCLFPLQPHTVNSLKLPHDSSLKDAPFGGRRKNAARFCSDLGRHKIVTN